jgi:glucose-1-phosphate thymidylyltransferase
MRVVIPVAGSGTRLRPHTYSQPKPLLEVGGKPIIAHLLDPIVKLQPEEIIFVIGYMGERIQQYVRANYRVKTTFIPQDRLLGLGYALHRAVSTIKSGDVLVVLGDTIVRCDLDKFTKAGDNVLGVLPVEDPTRFGIVTIDNGQIVELVEKPEKPPSNLAMIGLYYFRDVTPLREALQQHVDSGRITRGEIQFTDALQLMLGQGVPMVPYEVREWFDCGKKETLLSTNRYLVEKLGQHNPIPGSEIIDPVFIHPGAKVVNSKIGPAVSISDGAVIRNSQITNSIIGRNSTIEDAVLKDSLVGNDVRLKGGHLIANLGDSSEVESV